MKNEKKEIHATLAGVIKSVRNQNPGLDKALLELIDNSVDAESNTFYLTAGLIPDDIEEQSGLLPIEFNQQRRVAHTNIRR